MNEFIFIDTCSLLFTDAALREKLAKIIGSDFFRITPAMKVTADVAAEAAGNYGFQVPVQVENSVTQHDQQVKSLGFFLVLIFGDFGLSIVVPMKVYSLMWC